VVLLARRPRGFAPPPAHTQAKAEAKAKLKAEAAAASPEEKARAKTARMLMGTRKDGDSSSDDADDSSDDDNAFATKAFAAMGSTGKIVPLNRDIIRLEADGACA